MRDAFRDCNGEISEGRVLLTVFYLREREKERTKKVGKIVHPWKLASRKDTSSFEIQHLRSISSQRSFFFSSRGSPIIGRKGDGEMEMAPFDLGARERERGKRNRITRCVVVANRDKV